MRLLVVALYFHPARRYGGPIASSWNLCRGLAARGVAVRVLTTDADGPGRLEVAPGWLLLLDNLEVRYCRRAVGELLAPGLLAHLPREVAAADAVYVSGLFVWPLPALALLAHLTGRPLLLSPRGMLLPEALAGKPRRKRFFLALLRATLRNGVWHTTSAEESRSVREHFPQARIVCLPNPVEVPAELPARPESGPGAPPYLLYLGRLHPHKQIDKILEAFASWHRRHPGIEVDLQIAGGGDPALQARLAQRADELGMAGRVRFAGEVTGAEKARLLAGAEGLLLASKSENFGQSVAEALAHGTPCVVTRSAPWSRLEDLGCGFWVEEAALTEGIGRLMALAPEERRAMGKRGRAYVESELSVAAVARRMLTEIQDLVGS